MDQCALCQKSLAGGRQTVTLREKGSLGINKASEQRGDDIKTSPGQVVHILCRKNYCNSNLINSYLKEKAQTSTSSIPSCQLHSQKPIFNFQENCLFCSQPVVCRSTRQKRAYDDTSVLPVRTLNFKAAVETMCKKRGDEWAHTVQSRIEFVQDLHAVYAVYHQVCSVNFRTGECIPLKYQPTSDTKPQRVRRGRPRDHSKEKAFLKVADFLQESDDKQVTIGDLFLKMKEYCEHPYSVKYMKRKLEDHFANNLLITNINGKPDVVILRTTSADADILDKFYWAPKATDPEAKKIRLIQTAGSLIKNDIMSVSTSPEECPGPDDTSDLEHNTTFVPRSLKLFLSQVISEKNADLKITSLGQAIMQAARPKVVESGEGRGSSCSNSPAVKDDSIDEPDRIQKNYRTSCINSPAVKDDSIDEPDRIQKNDRTSCSNSPAVKDDSIDEPDGILKNDSTNMSQT